MGGMGNTPQTAMTVTDIAFVTNDSPYRVCVVDGMDGTDGWVIPLRLLRLQAVLIIWLLLLKSPVNVECASNIGRGGALRNYCGWKYTWSGGSEKYIGEGGSPYGSRWAAPSQALHSPDQGRPFLTSRPFYLLSITKFIWRLLRAATKFMRGTGARSMDWPSFASYSDNPSRLCSRFKSPRHKKKLKHERSTNQFYPIGSFVNMI